MAPGFSDSVCFLLPTLCLFATFSNGQYWPDGTYGLPQAKTGCPESSKFHWSEGWRYEDTEDTNPGNGKSSSFHLDAVVQNNDINRTFCIKADNSHSSKTRWPKGMYCIYKKGDCPAGLTEGQLFWDDENYKNINKMGGTLPDGIFNVDTRIEYCCRTDGDKMQPITLPTRNPFYLIAYNSSECQRVKGAVATAEFIRFDNEDKDNKDSWTGTYPFRSGRTSHNITYCYYENCDYTFSLDGRSQMEFTSPHFFGEGFPLRQSCSWRLLVPKDKTMIVTFLDFKLQKEDVLTIYHGWDEQSVTAAQIKGEQPGKNGYISQSNVFFLLLTSKSSEKSQGFRGIFRISKESNVSGPVWPSGTYGLPQTRIGCPKSNGFQWKIGWRYQDTEDNNPNNFVSTSFHLGIQVTKTSVNTSFCLKTDVKFDKRNGAAEWPKGQYCIYKKGPCPAGLEEGYIFWDDENHKNINKLGGTLPDGKYDEDTKIYFCCRTDGDRMNAVALPVSVPFYLLAYNSSECQHVQGALPTKEFIRFDNEDTGNKDRWNGTYPYGGGSANPRVTYCYYKACRTTISETNQVFQSPRYLEDGFPNSQFCSWRFTVQQNKGRQIVIQFTEFNLQKTNDNDIVRIYGGWDERSPLLVELNGKHPPPVNGLAFKTSTVYLVFISDSSGQSQGFTGIFINAAFNASQVTHFPITLPPATKATTLTTGATIAMKSTGRVETNNTSTATPSILAQGKKETTDGRSSVPLVIIVPVLLTVVVVAVLILYCIRRRRNDRRNKRLFDREPIVTVANSSYRNLESQEYDSQDEFQDVFPTA